MSEEATETGDVVCQDVSTCGEGQFISVEATENTDVICQDVSTCGDNQFISEEATETRDEYANRLYSIKLCSR